MRKTRSVWSCFLIGCMAFMLPSVLLADVTGSILGTVTDSSSAIIQGVRVTATNLDLNLVKETSTTESGRYRLLALPVGRYKVEGRLLASETSSRPGLFSLSTISGVLTLFYRSVRPSRK